MHLRQISDGKKILVEVYVNSNIYSGFWREEDVLGYWKEGLFWWDDIRGFLEMLARRTGKVLDEF
jgi:hypothetical protein